MRARALRSAGIIAAFTVICRQAGAGTVPTPVATPIQACPSTLALQSKDGNDYVASFYGPSALTAAIGLRLYASDSDYLVDIPAAQLSIPYRFADGRTWFRSQAVELHKASGKPLEAGIVRTSLGPQFASCMLEERAIASPESLRISQGPASPRGSLDATLAAEAHAAPPISLVPAPATRFPCANPFASAATTHVVTPGYPSDALRSRRAGKVKVLVLLDDTNAVTDANVYVSSGVPSLDAAALDAARATTYRAPLFACEPRGGSYIFRVDFTP